MSLKIFHFQIAASKQKAPHRIPLHRQLIINDLFIYLHPDGSALQQMLEYLFHVGIPFSDQLADQTVRAGICPVSTDFSLLKEIDDRPWIINILSVPECKTVIPLFYLLLLIRQAKFIQRFINFRLHKAKTVFILPGCGRYYFQIIQIRKNRFFADPCNARHNSTFQILIRLKSGIEQTPRKGHQFLPIPVHIGFLHGRIILIQQNDHFLPIIPAEKIRK